MKIFLFFVILLSSLSSFAQPETSRTTVLDIKPTADENQIDIAPLTPEEAPKLSDFGTERELELPKFATTQGKSIFDKPEFKNPAQHVAKNLNKELRQEERENLEQFKRNQYFGDFKTDSKYIRVVYRDHIYFDGDRVQIIMNGRILYNDVLLESSYKQVEIDLQHGFNKIEILALNQGTSGPNTAEFQIYDDQGTLICSNQWELATGYKGTVILVKER
ncbi:MAG: hypothetical protein WCY89_05565 [Flavobacteriaceae bacterium]